MSPSASGDPLLDDLADYWHLAGPAADTDADADSARYSSKRSLWMALCAAAAYADPAEADKIFRAAGCDLVIPIIARDTEAYLARHPGGSRPVTVLSFRGTRGLQDMFSDVKAKRMKVPWLPACRAHQGFLVALEAVWNEIVHHVQASRPETLFVTGHSLGGALAILAGYRLTLQGSPCRPAAIYTIGCPRVGNGALAQRIDESVKVYRVVWAGDQVPHLPPWYFGYRHAGEERWLRPGASSVQPKYLGRTIVEWLFPREPDLVTGTRPPPKSRRSRLANRLRWLQLSFYEFHVAQVAVSAAAILALVLAWLLIRGEVEAWTEHPVLVMLGLAGLLFVLIQVGIQFLPSRGPRWARARLRIEWGRDHGKLDYIRELAARVPPPP